MRSPDDPTSSAAPTTTSPPKPIVKKMRWPFPLIWLVPICAALAAGYLVFRHFQDRGPVISIAFKDADGVKEGDTPVQYRGVEVGKVIHVDLADNGGSARVQVRLRRSAKSIATKGAAFWIVRPELTAASLQGLSTIMTGPYIQAVPGAGAAQSEFHGLDNAPAVSDQNGLHIILEAKSLEHLQPGSPIMYRGFQVGAIESAEMGRDATHVDAHAIVWKRYARLVRVNSKFWNVSGAEVKGGIFTGVDVKVGSLGSLFSGGVAFASPDHDLGDRAADGTRFALNDEAKKEWLSWSPRILVDPDLPGEPQTDAPTAPANPPTAPKQQAIPIDGQK